MVNADLPASFVLLVSRAGGTAIASSARRLVTRNGTGYTAPRDPGLRLHPLKGERKGVWAVWVSGNWRVTFRFVGVDADVVDHEDYR